MKLFSRYKNDKEDDDPLQTSSYYGSQIARDPSLLEIDLSTPSSPTSIKPRGIEEIYDEHDPKQWSKTKKSLMLIFNCFGGMLVGLSNSIFYPIIPLVSNELGFSEESANIIVATYLCFVGIVSLGWAVYSDDHGTRRRAYLVSFSLYGVASITCALSDSFWMLMITRVFQACGISAVLCVGAGIISDLYVPTERGFAYGIFFAGYLTGHMTGPIIGGLIGFGFGWRWIFCFCSVFGLILLLFTYSLPETFYDPSLLTTHPLSHSFNRPPDPSKLKNSQKFINPLSPLSLLFRPNTALTIIYLMSTSLILYLQDTLLLNLFATQYGFLLNDSIIIFLVISLGCIAGCLIGGMYSDFTLRKLKSSSNSEIFHAEMRLNGIWFGVALTPLVYSLCGWSLQEKWSVFIPISTMYLGGFTIYWVLIANSTYLIDINPTKSSSVIALNNSTRFILGGMITGFYLPLHKLVSIGWVFVIASGINVLCILLMVIVLLKGEKWREESK